MPSTPHNKNFGFTLVEMLVIAPIVILTIGSFIATLIYMTGDTLTTRANNTMAYEVQDALDQIEQDARLSGAFLARNNVTLSAGQGYDNNTQVFDSISSAYGHMLIMNIFATTKNPLDSTRNPVYLSNLPNACASDQVAQNKVMTMNIVYFVKDGSLWRRTITPSNYTSRGCSAPWQIPSCSPTLVTPPSFCRTNDMKVVSNIQQSDFTISYYDSPQASSPNASAVNLTLSTRQAAMVNIDTIEVRINSTALIAGRDISQEGVIRATRIGAYNDSVTPVP